MKEIKIDKNIPRTKKRSTYKKYPWDQMKVDDSFFAEYDSNGAQTINAFRSSLHSTGIAWALRNKKEWKFSTSIEENGVRIWRIK